MTQPGRLTNPKRLALALILLSVAGCSTTVKMTPEPLPKALVEPYPLTAALRFGDSIEKFVYEETLPGGAKYTIDLGAASAKMFRATLKDMFSSVVDVPSGTRPPDGVDLLVEPSLLALEFALPSQTVTKDYAVWIKYRVKVYDDEGKLQADYPLAAYGKSTRESLMGGQESALTSAASLALRDAAVLLLTRFEKETALSERQLAQLGVAELPVATDATIDNRLPSEATASDAEKPPAEAPQAEQFL